MTTLTVNEAALQAPSSAEADEHAGASLDVRHIGECQGMLFRAGRPSFSR